MTSLTLNQTKPTSCNIENLHSVQTRPTYYILHSIMLDDVGPTCQLCQFNRRLRLLFFRTFCFRAQKVPDHRSKHYSCLVLRKRQRNTLRSRQTRKPGSLYLHRLRSPRRYKDPGLRGYVQGRLPATARIIKTFKDCCF